MRATEGGQLTCLRRREGKSPAGIFRGRPAQANSFRGEPKLRRAETAAVGRFVVRTASVRKASLHKKDESHAEGLQTKRFAGRSATDLVKSKI